MDRCVVWCACVCVCVCCLSCVLLDTFSHFSDVLPSPSNSVERLRFWFWTHSSHTGDFKQPQNPKKKKIRHHFGSARILLFTKKHIFTFMRCIFTYTFPILYFSAGVAVRNETDFCRTYCEELFCGNFEFRSVFLDSAALLSGHILVQSVCLFVLKKMLHHSCLVISSPGFYTNACSTTITIQVIIRIP